MKTDIENTVLGIIHNNPGIGKVHLLRCLKDERHRSSKRELDLVLMSLENQKMIKETKVGHGYAYHVTR